MSLRSLSLSIIAGVMICFNVSAQSVTDVQLYDALTDKPVQLKDKLQPDKTTIIVFWATWNAPSKLEVRKLADLLTEKGNVIDLIAVSVDKPVTKGLVKTYATAQKWTFPAYRDDAGIWLSELMEDNFVGTPPLTIIVNKNGEIVHRHIGYEVGQEQKLYEKATSL